MDLKTRLEPKLIYNLCTKTSRTEKNGMADGT